MYLYTLFGLNIESSLLLPELLPGKPGSPIDLIIREGTVPLALDDVKARGVIYEINAHQFSLALDGIARYFVSDGKEIIVEPAAGADDSSVRVFLLGSAVGALLHQRGMLPLHGSCIESPKGAVLFIGTSGAGKSTTATAFHKRGYPILADDISVIQVNKGVPVVLPGYPQMKLWAEALDKLDENPQSLQKIRPQLEKYALPISQGFRSAPLPVHAVYFLTMPSGNELGFTPLVGLDKITMLKRHIYRARFLDQMGKVNDSILAFINGIRMCEVYRPADQFTINELVEMLERDFSA